MFYELAPEVAGHLGSGTVIDHSTRPPVARQVHYEFDDRPEDDLIEAFPCFIVTDRMKGLIKGANLSGCRFGPVTVTTSEQFDELKELDGAAQSAPLPSFTCLIITGAARQDDFGASATGALIVSDKALQVLKQGQLGNCDVMPI